MTGTTDQAADVERFTLLGGPLHGLGRRLGLVRGDANTVPLGLVLGPGAWVVLMALAAFQGFAREGFSLAMIAAHVRLLVVIPLCFLAEAWVDPRMTAFVRMIARAGVVPASTIPSLNRRIARSLRWKDSWIPDGVCLAVAVFMTMSGSPLALGGPTATFFPAQSGGGLTLAGAWYWFVCLPLFRFLALRWLWRLAEWVGFLWQLTRQDLHLVPTHPDGAAGLGYLEVVQSHFLPLVLAVSGMLAATFTEDYIAGATAFEAVYPAIGVTLLANLVLVLGPVFIFAPKLWACRVNALSDYMEFASGYVAGFERKWLGAAPPKDELLGTPDLQSLADLGNSMGVVRDMNIVPASFRMVRDLVVIALLPTLPLLLLKYPIAELAQKIFSRLAGL